MTELEFNGKKYSVIQDKDGWFQIRRSDGTSLGCAAAFHGAVNACCSGAFPREPRRSLRVRP